MIVLPAPIDIGSKIVVRMARGEDPLLCTLKQVHTNDLHRYQTSGIIDVGIEVEFDEPDVGGARDDITYKSFMSAAHIASVTVVKPKEQA